MADQPPTPPRRRGPIAWMAGNPVAANLLMIGILAAGLLGMSRVKQEVFPLFTLDIINVTVPYPGASPAEVEQGIVLAVEEQVRGVEGVKRVTSISAEGSGNVSVELLLSAEPEKVLADVKNAVDRIRTFPEEAEEPTVAIASRKSRVISLVIAGDQELSTLQAIAEKARAALLARPEITLVEIEGVRPLEVAIELSRETLRSYGLTLDQVARQVAASSLELPGGGIDTVGGELLVRVSDRKQRGEDFEEILLRGSSGGFPLRLGDIAKVVDGYADTDQASYFNGTSAVRVTAYRVGGETPIAVAAAVRDYAKQLRGELPGNIEVALWNDNSEMLAGRIDLLVRNARLGFVLVLFILALFLETRLAGWVAFGIPTSFMGAFLLLPVWDMSINMITLFGLIVTLGMVVDDAIIIGENIYSKLQAGVPRMKAVVEGTREMATPVTFSVLTTVAAFAPMFVVPGVMGKIFGLFPAVVVSVLGFSLIESFFVLPAHLAHAAKRENRLLVWMSGLHHFGDRLMKGLRERWYGPALAWALSNRPVILALAAGSFLLTIGMLRGGIVPFNFFPIIEGDVITASARLPYGAPLQNTERVRVQIEQAGRAAIEANGGGEIFRGMFTMVGQGPRAQGPGRGAPLTGSHLVTVQVFLTASEQRDVTADHVANAWRAALPPMAGVEAIKVSASAGPSAGAAAAIQLSHRDNEVLAAASEELAQVMRGYPSLVNVENGYASGKPQLDFVATPEAVTQGLTAGEIARQIRSSFYGAEALREQRGRHELKVMVRLPERQRHSEADLEELRIRTPGGGDIPLSRVASFTRGKAPTSIRRDEGQRVVEVKGDLADGVASPREVLASLQAEVFPELREKYPGLTLGLSGQQREQAETFRSLGSNYLLALLAIFALLAVPFRSYLQPLIVMSAIPFGFVGAVWGHLMMGYSMSVISMFGIIALSGVVVNDSLVLIDSTNKLRRAGASAYEAIFRGANRRLRPILLTSLTTFFGLVPMIFEQSVQARFLIPMAISLGFGILFATFVILFLVPVQYTFIEQLRGRLGQPVHSTAELMRRIESDQTGEVEAM